jgi:hypothetical protein
MGIDIYAQWDGITEREKQAQICCFSVVHGYVGYLREAYHGEPYATKVLVPEAFEELRVPIYAARLQERLPAVLVVAEARERKIYRTTDPAKIERIVTEFPRLRRAVRTQRSRDRRALSHHRELLARAHTRP